MRIDEKVWELVRGENDHGLGPRAVPNAHQGISKARIRRVLRRLDLDHDDITDAVFAMLDDQRPSWFSGSAAGTLFCDGASIAMLGCHIGILQRQQGKLDREGRDYWVKPLRALKAVEAIYLDPQTGTFLPGHPKAKSPNSAYRLEAGFVDVLRAPDGEREALLGQWASEDAVRHRAQVQAEAAEAARRAVDTSHADLIQATIDYYVPRYLPGFEPLYVDDADGDRITDHERAAMEAAGIELTLADAMPDVLLWDPRTDWLWVIEAVTSDGEVDLHKVEQLQRLADRSGKAGVGFTTVYRTWGEVAARQSRYHNIAPGTFLWVLEDAAKQFRAETFEAE